MTYSNIRSTIAMSSLCACAFAVQISGATLLVGPSRTYKAPNAVAAVVKDGDTVLIDTGTYAGEVSTWTKNNLTLRGKSKFAHVIAPSVISNGKAIWAERPIS
jgi:hypothetical protein